MNTISELVTDMQSNLVFDGGTLINFYLGNTVVQHIRRKCCRGRQVSVCVMQRDKAFEITCNAIA